MSEPAASRVPHSAALYLAVLQFLFVTTWARYISARPARYAGIPKRYVLWILMFDQLVFMVMDAVMGVAADRAGRLLGCIGPLILGATATAAPALPWMNALVLSGLAIGGALAPFRFGPVMDAGCAMVCRQCGVHDALHSRFGARLRQ